MTHEQLRICNYNVGSGETVKIVAFAGKLSKMSNQRSLLLKLIGKWKFDKKISF